MMWYRNAGVQREPGRRWRIKIQTELKEKLIFNSCGTNERFGKRGVRNLPFLLDMIKYLCDFIGAYFACCGSSERTELLRVERAPRMSVPVPMLGLTGNTGLGKVFELERRAKWGLDQA